VEQTRAIIRHAITDAGNEEVSTKIAVVTLMKGEATKQVRRCFGGGGGTFMAPCQGRRVVSPTRCGCFGNVDELGQHIIVCDGAGKFKIRIGDTTTRVAKGNQLRLDVFGELRPPEDGLLQLRKAALVAGGKCRSTSPHLINRNFSVYREPNSTHSWGRSIMCTNKFRLVGD
jgi:hypothetical protein